jgi:hypothetical protein
MRQEGDGLCSRSSGIIDPANNLLKDGALRINVTIQVKQKKQDMHQPLSPLSSKMLNVLKSSEKRSM